MFKEGELFDLQIRVTDSDHWGVTENTASIRIISGDLCKNIQEIYDEAVKYCIKLKKSESVDGEKWCLTELCIEAAHDWKEALNNASQVPEKNCSADPHHLATVMREHPRCGKSRIEQSTPSQLLRSFFGPIAEHIFFSQRKRCMTKKQRLRRRLESTP